MINKRLYWWLEASQLLNVHQAGFRSGHRTEDQLFTLTQSIIDGFHEKKHTAAVFVDLKQAYDRVWRKGLLLKMKRMGIHGHLYSWVKNFLSNRIIQTRVNHATSSKQVLEEGLPQGSSLSCTLFLIFINDLPEELHSQKTLFADDLTLWQTDNQIEISAMQLNADLKRLENYCTKWRLKINTAKTVYTVFSNSPKTSKKDLLLEIGDEQLLKEQNPVYLGVTLDSKLTLKEHVQNVKEKSTRRLKIIKRLASTQWGSDKNTLRQLYIGYVRSTMEYNLALQSISSDTTQASLDRVESSAVHFISGAMRSAPTAACHIHTDIQPLGLRREAAVLEMAERYRREEDHKPNAKIVHSWNENTRIKKRSILKVEKRLQEKHHLPQNREIEHFINKNIPPSQNLKKPSICLELKKKVTKQKTDLVDLQLTGLQTIQDYPESWIHIYTDGSAMKGTVNAGLGARIEYPNQSYEEISNPCGSLCSNFEAEALAMKAAISKIANSPEKYENIVLFTDSKSVLDALLHDNFNLPVIRDLAYVLDNFREHLTEKSCCNGSLATVTSEEMKEQTY